ncbi:very-long-chain 3-oxoacyl-CoA reductase-like, partial [Melanaphis sacchari]
ERHAGRVKTKIVAADFTSLGGDVPLANSYDKVRHELGRMDVRLLVNNAGVSYARPERLLDLAPACAGAPPDPCRDMVECNALATVAMCSTVMPLMVAGAGGVVVNVSSASAHLPCPMLSVYGAAK